MKCLQDSNYALTVNWRLFARFCYSRACRVLRMQNVLSLQISVLVTGIVHCFMHSVSSVWFLRSNACLLCMRVYWVRAGPGTDTAVETPWNRTHAHTYIRACMRVCHVSLFHNHINARLTHCVEMRSRIPPPLPAAPRQASASWSEFEL
jgi:ferredoxin